MKLASTVTLRGPTNALQDFERKWDSRAYSTTIESLAEELSLAFDDIYSYEYSSMHSIVQDFSDHLTVSESQAFVWDESDVMNAEVVRLSTTEIEGQVFRRGSIVKEYCQHCGRSNRTHTVWKVRQPIGYDLCSLFSEEEDIFEEICTQNFLDTVSPATGLRYQRLEVRSTPEKYFSIEADSSLGLPLGEERGIRCKSCDRVDITTLSNLDVFLRPEFIHDFMFNPLDADMGVLYVSQRVYRTVLTSSLNFGPQFGGNPVIFVNSLEESETYRLPKPNPT